MPQPMSSRFFVVFVLSCSAIFLAVGCGGSGGTITGGPASLSLGSSMALAPQDGTPAVINASLSRASGDTGSVSLVVNSLPVGVNSVISQPGTGSSGSITLTASSAVAAGTYSVTVDAVEVGREAGPVSQQPLSLVVAVSAVVSNSVDASSGVNGKLQQFMSTSFQPAEWDYQFFQNHVATEPAQLNALGVQHIRIQGVSQAVPMRANSSPQLASNWDFSKLDAIVQPVLGVADNSPEFQIPVAPALPGLVDSSGHLIVNSANLTLFASYCANLVRYYNKGGFDWGGTHFQSPSPHPITWWGIFNEYNINGLTPAEYVQLYNAVVPAMLAVDSSIKFSAIELSDYDFNVGDPRNNLPTFLAAAGSGGVNAQVNVLSTHFYGSCNQTDPDTQVFGTVPGFVSDLKYFYQELQLRPDLGNVAVWVTENNVNADFSDASGNSVCNPGQKFVSDTRGSSAFFAAWRPYVFSQLGKAGNQGLYHWDYDADAQGGEVDYTTGNKYLSYWVDYWLAKTFPSTPASPGPDILALTNTEPTANATLELLATRNADGSVVLMVADRAVHASGDNNGTGDPRTVVFDISALGNFSSAAQLVIDKNTSVTSGPMPTAISLSPKLAISLGGYGVTMVTLKP
ncbi:MAG TPA: hypothetical protein VGF20_15085 [Candidatus Acidoferrum sp.]